jgi:hypothetical protein
MQLQLRCGIADGRPSDEVVGAVRMVQGYEEAMHWWPISLLVVQTVCVCLIVA